MRVKALSAAQILEALARHAETIESENPGALKRSPESCVSVVAVDGWQLCVKQFRSRGVRHGLKDYIRPSPARRSWRAAWQLRERGIGAPDVYALVVPATSSVRGDSFVVMEPLSDAQPIHRFTERMFRSCDPATRKRFLAEAAAFIRRLHEADLYHTDLKASNIFVRHTDEGFEFFLIDLASIQRVARVSAARRLRNLAQLHASTGRWVTNADRLRFLRACLAGDRRLRDERAVLRDLARRIAKRKVVWEQ